MAGRRGPRNSSQLVTVQPFLLRRSSKEQLRDLADSGDEEEGSDCDEGVGDGEQRTRVGDEGGLLVGELESLSAGPIGLRHRL